MKRKDMISVSVRIPTKIHEALELVAKKYDAQISWTIRKLLKDGIEAENAKK